MEIIKKKILQLTTTGTTTDCTGDCKVIIPDLTAIYHFKISLTQEAHDWGFFDVNDPESMVEVIGEIDGSGSQGGTP